MAAGADADTSPICGSAGSGSFAATGLSVSTDMKEVNDAVCHAAKA
jgi:hypothetical protein